MTGSMVETVDVVVVGAGAAGCVVAARLAQAGEDVLLLEAGPAQAPAHAAVPGRAQEVQAPPWVWSDPSPPQDGLGGRALDVITGKGLGGGTAVNSMAWFQGLPEDYDGWVAQGAPGWGWEEVLPHLRRSEDHELGASGWHGAGGPMAVSTTSLLHPLSLAFVQSAAASGIPVSRDLNGAEREGVGLIQSTIRDGRRWSAVEGYLALAGDGLRVRAECTVARLLLEGRRAVGVRTAAGDEVLARRGVVLCAGAVRTPQLLLLAGLGPQEHLHEHGIGVVHHAPGVGADLHDHPLVPLVWPAPGAASVRGASAGVGDPRAVWDSLGRGPLAAGGQVAATTRSAAHVDAPDLQMVFALTGVDAGQADQGTGQDAVAGFAALLTPSSRGTVRLADDDPASSPVVDPRYLQTEHDRDRLRAGVRQLMDVFTREPLASLTADPVGLGAHPSDSELDAYVAASATPYWHLVGTARMGDDPTAVVDPTTMAVAGTDRLHVVDASVFPAVTRGNTQAAVIAVAERAVPLLRRAWAS